MRRWSVRPLLQMLDARVPRRSPRKLERVATRTWEIAPRHVQDTPPALYLPGQLERVVAWVFSDEHPGRAMRGMRMEHRATRAIEVEHALLLDGVLYSGGACSHLHPRSHRPWPRLEIDREIDRAGIVCSSGGNQYFGTWLMDDCPRYPLAAAEGEPVTTAQPTSPHQRQYEDWLGMRPTRTEGAYLRRAVLFDDFGQNRDKHARCRAIADTLRARVDATRHPGVFIVRGAHGQRRLLRNELELAERLRDRYGFRIVDPMQLDVPAIVAACAGARIAVGIEGSALVHAMQVLEPGTGVVTLQPPHRFCALLKGVTDRDGQTFGFVVGHGAGSDFSVDVDELERTLDLFPPSVRAV